jgi:hypothetical protein
MNKTFVPSLPQGSQLALMPIIKFREV